MRINVHNFSLDDVLDEILYKFDECIELGDYKLEIIHGYKHGTRIRDYLRSNGFLKEMARKRHQLTRKNVSDPGITVFELRLSKKA